MIYYIATTGRYAAPWGIFDETGALHGAYHSYASAAAAFKRRGLNWR